MRRVVRIYMKQSLNGIAWTLKGIKVKRLEFIAGAKAFDADALDDDVDDLPSEAPVAGSSSSSATSTPASTPQRGTGDRPPAAASAAKAAKK